MILDFSIVDVFAEQKYQGNQLAVFHNANGLTDEQMLRIAREIGFQESTFILSDKAVEGAYDVKIFTPEYEVPFAGHPTLGTAYILMKESETEVTLNLKVGRVPVNVANEILWLEITNPTFGETFTTDVAPLLSIKPEDIDEIMPIQLVSTGLPYLIIPVKTLKAIQEMRLEEVAIKDWLTRNKLYKTNSPDGLTVAFFAFTAETHAHANHLHARMFCLENDKIVEDAATGSANSCLLAYLLKHELPMIHKLVEQGYEMKRPSLINIKGELNQEGSYKLQVGGKVKLVAQGKWFV
ncbi:PhzF family phenazine biosynthesis protein [Emticicia sp. C21]|uniref:PhzF family phenazine biosynthesis protein n=1 Tax=Emticicia sp. C21 TaxID=2302915 RepID=UPI000E34AFA2|nr:PhzF family phenazine biosynthesis protein [Emticicia sp. C21]RFS16700.1 PhzF family phenazine biosynthesis protein [Emticicia sp. C21]